MKTKESIIQAIDNYRVEIQKLDNEIKVLNENKEYFDQQSYDKIFGIKQRYELQMKTLQWVLI